MSVAPLASAGHADRERSASEADRLAAGEFTLLTRRLTVSAKAETGLLVVWNEADRLVSVLSAWGTSRGGPAVRRSRWGFVGRVLDAGRPTVERINSAFDASLGYPASGARIAYAAGAGIRPPGGPRGALCLGFSSRPSDLALTLWQIESYARLASLCLHETGTLDALLETARRDGLAGCLSYAAIRAELDREVARSERHGRPLSCCFIDLDNFKRVNDCHGHLYGNRVLAQVGAALGRGVRAGDSIGRYGGDGFLAILPDTDEAAALALGERLRLSIFAAKPSGTDGRLDTSIGIAQWRPGWTADHMLGAADDALLRAKHGGGAIVAGASGVTAEKSGNVVWRSTRAR